jgi:hypothetical protein
MGRSTAFNATLFLTTIFGLLACLAPSFSSLCFSLFFLGSAVGVRVPFLSQMHLKTHLVPSCDRSLGKYAHGRDIVSREHSSEETLPPYRAFRLLLRWRGSFRCRWNYYNTTVQLPREYTNHCSTLRCGDPKYGLEIFIRHVNCICELLA